MGEPSVTPLPRHRGCGCVVSRVGRWRRDDRRERRRSMAMLVREGEAARSHPLEPVVPGGVRVRHLVKTYPGPVEALRDVSFDVQPGEVFRLLGPNGAGKSTAVGVLTTTVRPTGGRVLVGGYDVTTQPLEARRVSSVVFQDPAVDRGLSGRRNLEI